MNNIQEKLDELIHLVKNQEEVILFNQIEERLRNNQSFNNQLNEFRKMQQKHVLYENKNGEIPFDVQEKYDHLLTDLLDIPVFNEYLFLQNEINEMIQQITFIIEKEINDGLNRIRE